MRSSVTADGSTIQVRQKRRLLLMAQGQVACERGNMEEASARRRTEKREKKVLYIVSCCCFFAFFERMTSIKSTSKCLLTFFFFIPSAAPAKKARVVCTRIDRINSRFQNALPSMHQPISQSTAQFFSLSKSTNMGTFSYFSQSGVP